MDLLIFKDFFLKKDLGSEKRYSLGFCTFIFFKNLGTTKKNWCLAHGTFYSTFCSTVLQGLRQVW